jgi:hypothetical protein
MLSGMSLNRGIDDAVEHIMGGSQACMSIRTCPKASGPWQISASAWSPSPTGLRPLLGGCWPTQDWRKPSSRAFPSSRPESEAGCGRLCPTHWRPVRSTPRTPCSSQPIPGTPELDTYHLMHAARHDVASAWTTRGRAGSVPNCAAWPRSHCYSSRPHQWA